MRASDRVGELRQILVGPGFAPRACTYLVRRIDSGRGGGISESGIRVISIAALLIEWRCRHVVTN